MSLSPTRSHSWLSYLTVAVLVITPFQVLWTRFLEQQGLTGRTLFIVSNWYEPVIIMVALLAFQASLSKVRIRWIDWLALAFLIFAAVSYFWSNSSLSHHLIGLRYSALAIVAYFIGRFVFLEERLLERVLKLILYGVLLVVAIQALSWALGIESILKIRWLAAEAPRLYGSFPGPNQLATYLVIMTLWLLFSARRRLPPLAVMVAVLTVVFTFSRSALLAMVGAVVIGWVGGIHLRRSWALGLGILAAAAVLTLVSYWAGINVVDLVATDRHTPERLEALGRSWQLFSQASPAELLVGHGAGTAGPATFVRNMVYIPENWFIQIAFEYGVVGLLLLLGFWFSALKRFLAENWGAGIVVLIAMMINSLFLHPLSDNPVAALLFYFLLGYSVTITQPNAQPAMMKR